jgi:hypothetical protein
VKTYSISPRTPPEFLQPELESMAAGWSRAAPRFRLRSSVSEQAEVVIAAVADMRSNSHRIRRVVWQVGSSLPYGGLVNACEVDAPAGLIESLDEALQQLSLPPFAEGPSGLDGSSAAVERSGYGADWVRLSWWMRGPPQWEDLRSWHARAWAALADHLPEVPLQFDIGYRTHRKGLAWPD